MPNLLVRPADMCNAKRADGNQCSAARLRGGQFCIFHADDPRNRAKPSTGQVVPKDSLASLLDLDVSSPENLVRLSRGLRQHIAAGTILANAASQIMRFAREEAVVSMVKHDGSLAREIAALVATAPATDRDEPPGG